MARSEYIADSLFPRPFRPMSDARSNVTGSGTAMPGVGPFSGGVLFSIFVPFIA